MKNVIRKKDFRIFMIVYPFLFGVIYLLMGVPFFFLLMAFEWMWLIGIFFMFRPLRRKEVKAINQLGAAFTRGHFIRLPDADNSRFNAIIDRGKPYLLIAKFKWGIGLVLVLATAFYIFRSVDISFPHPVFGGIEVVSFFILAYLFAGIVFGSIILVMWLAVRIPRICYKRASFYALPAEEEKEEKEEEEEEKEEKEGIKVIKGHEGKMIIEQENGCLLSPHRLLLLMIENKGKIPTGRLVSVDVLCLGGEPVLPNKEMVEGEIQKNFLKERKSIVFY